MGGLLTSRLADSAVVEFTPAQTNSQLSGCTELTDFFGDSSGSAYYLSINALVDSSEAGGCEGGLYLGLLQQQLCDFIPGPFVAQDNANLYFSANATTLTVVPKP